MLRSIFSTFLVFHVLLSVPAVFLLIFEKHTGKVSVLRRVLLSIFVPIAGPLYSLCLYLFADPGKPSDRYFGQSVDESPVAFMMNDTNHHP